MENDPITLDGEPHFGADRALKPKLWREYGLQHLLLRPGLVLMVALAFYPHANWLLGLIVLVLFYGVGRISSTIQRWQQRHYRLGDEFLLVMGGGRTFSVGREYVQQMVVETTGRGQVQKIRLKIPDEKIVIEAQDNFAEVALQLLAWYDTPGQVRYHRDWRPEPFLARLALNFFILLIFGYLVTISSPFGVAFFLFALALSIFAAKLGGYLQPGRGTFAIIALVIAAAIVNNLHREESGYWGWEHPCGFIAQATGFNQGCTKIFYGTELGGFTADSQSLFYTSGDFLIVEPLFGPLTNLRSYLFEDLGYLLEAKTLANGEIQVIFYENDYQNHTTNYSKLSWRPGEVAQLAQSNYLLPEFSINRSPDGYWAALTPYEKPHGLYDFTTNSFTPLGDINAAAFSPDNQLVAVQEMPQGFRQLNLYQLQKGLQKITFPTPLKDIYCLRFAPDQPWLVANDGSVLKVWDINSQEIIFERPLSVLIDIGRPCFLEFLPGRDTLITLTWGEKLDTLQLWLIPIALGQPTRSISLPYNSEIALSPDGQWLAFRLSQKEQIWLMRLDELFAEPEK